jgi:hypothetical protein
MSIFGDMMDRIRSNSARKDAAKNQPTGIDEVRPSAAADAAKAAAPAASSSSFDVGASLEAMAKGSSEKLDWRTSIVDLMKLLKIDSDITNRRALAHELGYTGDLNDSATMNTWLHEAVMQKLAENGGVVPANIAD